MLNLSTKKCLNCDNNIKLKITRDIIRKKFCSRKCMGLYTVNNLLPQDHVYKTMHPKCNTPEANVKKGRQGHKHHFYKKDRSKIKAKRPRYENDKWRLEVFKRDDYTCQICGQRGGKLNADHIKSYHAHIDIRWDLDNGRTLCIKCHKQTPTYGKNSNASS